MIELLHPRLVHFPIALLLTSVALSWASLHWKDKGLDQAAWYLLLLGLAGTILTLISGLIAARAVPADSPAMATLNIHKLLGIAVLVIFSAQALCHIRSRSIYTPTKRVLHTAIQLLGVALILAVGFLGGELVYTFGIGVSSMP